MYGGVSHGKLVCMADSAAEIKIWSNGEAKREEITNYDEVQDYLAET